MPVDKNIQILAACKTSLSLQLRLVELCQEAGMEEEAHGHCDRAQDLLFKVVMIKLVMNASTKWKSTQT